MASQHAKELKIGVRTLDAIRSGRYDSHYQVHAGKPMVPVGTKSGCCKWDAINKYLGDIDTRSDDCTPQEVEAANRLWRRLHKKEGQPR